MIDTDTDNIIVPYNEEAEALIEKITAEQNPKETVRLLRQAQKYAVSIYSGTHRILDESDALCTVSCGRNSNITVKVLKKSFYDPQFGVTTEGGEHEVLIL